MRADRLLALLLLLQAHERLSAPELARRLEVSVRTVYRDMEALGAAGFPVYAERGRTGGCVLLPGFRTDVSGLTAGEAEALFVLTGGTAVADLGLGAEARSALRKLSAGVPAAVRDRADRLARHVVIDPRGWNRPAEPDAWLPVLRAAVVERRRVRLRYRGGGGEGTRLVDPWGLVAKAGTWYLVAAHRGRPRLFRVSRVLAATVLAEPVTRPADLDLDAVWDGLRRDVERPRAEPVEVVLRVRRATAGLLLRICAPQLAAPAPEPVPEADDAGRVRLVLLFKALDAARGVLLGFGTDVEVVAPAVLRTRMRTTAAEVVRLYDADADADPGPADPDDAGVPD